MTSVDIEPAGNLLAHLTRWYGTHSCIRHLRAVRYRDEFIAFVTLEPTSDGNDTLPTWLAKREGWAQELRSLMDAEVQLEMNMPDDFDASDATVIAELTCRDAWISA